MDLYDDYSIFCEHAQILFIDLSYLYITFKIDRYYHEIHEV